MKRVLFINAKRKKCKVVSPHLGLAMLSAVLKKAGHQVLVVDYQFRHSAKPIEEFITEFKPDVVGISLYTAAFREGERIIDAIRNFNIPIIVGGPHASLYSDDLLQDNRIDYIVKGEAENIICKLVSEAKKQDSPQLIESKPLDPSSLPFPDFTSFFEIHELSDYPWLTSRGCPYNCSFCAVHLISSKTSRRRCPQECVEELLQAKQKFHKLRAIGILDDCLPNKQHIKDLLNLYIKKQINLPLTILNLRADCIDEDIISLLKRCCSPSLNIGAEHGHPDVFRQINKSETLEEIKTAAKLIKKYDMALYLCFIIGLPGDSFKKTKYSINLARELKADFVIWNLFVPYEGTRAMDYFRNQPGVRINNEVNHSSWVDGDFMCDEPCVVTPEFSATEQKKAYLMAILETGHPFLNWNSIPRLIPYVARYGLCLSFFNWLYRRIKDSRLKRLFRNVA